MVRMSFMVTSKGYVVPFHQTLSRSNIYKSNILVGETGVACLCDFGLSRIKTYSTVTQVNPEGVSGTLQWTAPEQLINGSTSKQADIYSFAMTMYEVRIDFTHARQRFAHFVLALCTGL